MDLKDVLTGVESIVGAKVKEGTLSLNRGLGVGIWSNWRRWRHGLEVTKVTCAYLNHINPAEYLNRGQIFTIPIQTHVL